MPSAIGIGTQLLTSMDCMPMRRPVCARNRSSSGHTWKLTLGWVTIGMWMRWANCAGGAGKGQGHGNMGFYGASKSYLTQLCWKSGGGCTREHSVTSASPIFVVESGQKRRMEIAVIEAEAADITRASITYLLSHRSRCTLFPFLLPSGWRMPSYPSILSSPPCTLTLA